MDANREVGDLQRAAVLWLTTRAHGDAVSFAFPSVPRVDEGRLGEATYLACVGFLLDAAIIAAPTRASSALRSVLRRSARTLERSGYADDPLRVAGLYLLGRCLADAEAISTIEAAIDEPSTHADAASVLLALATQGLKSPPATLQPSSAEQLALAILASAADHVTTNNIFPSFEREAAAQKFVGEMTLGRVAHRADLDAMITLAAAETIAGGAGNARPSDSSKVHLKDTNRPVDIAILIALKEEFKVLKSLLPQTEPVEEGGRHYYLCDLNGATTSYRCVATFIGDMGPTRAGIVAEKTLERWKPATAVMMGIAAGIHDDMRVGDVVVASQIDNYLEKAKAVDLGEEFRFEHAGDAFQVDHVLLDRVRNFEFRFDGDYQRWRTEGRKDLDDSGVDLPQLLQRNLVRREPELHDAHLASGPILAASAHFISWVRTRDRGYKVLEMESGGFALSAHMNVHGAKALVVRGISDYGDTRKKELDAVGGGRLRAYAMANATRLLFALIRADLLPGHPV